MTSFFSKYYNYLFLVVVLFYNVFPKKARPFVLLLASLIFYFIISKFLILCLISTIISIYFSARLLDKFNKKRDLILENASKEEKQNIKQKYKKRNKIVLLVCILFNVAFLFVFKYLKFFVINTNAILDLFNINSGLKVHKIIAPIGVSFYTLQALSYLFDVYNGKQECDKNFFRVALFISFFPQIMEGPMARYEDTAKDLYEGHKVSYNNLCFGLQRIGWGLFKKIVIADRLNIAVKTVFSDFQTLSGPVIFMGAAAYTMMLYMEFSASIDVVIGIGEMFKTKIPENFRQPFFSKNISEFWTRWHISLGKWFKDYIYYPISLSKPLKKLTGKMRKVLGNYYGPLMSGSVALFTVWLLNGLWHGAGWTFIVFGLYHFLLIFIENITQKPINALCAKLKINQKNYVYRFFQSVRVIFLVIIGELIFRADTMGDAITMLRRMFTKFNVHSWEFTSLGLDMPDYVILIISIVTVLVIGILREMNVNIREKIAGKHIAIRWAIYYILIFAILIFGAYGPGYEPIDPIYADF